MTVQIFERVSGDTGPPVDDVLFGIDDLATVDTIEAILYRKRETTGTCPVTIVSVATCEISTDLAAWLPTVRSGDWKLKYRVKFLSADRWTWESGRPDVVRVAPNPKPGP